MTIGASIFLIALGAVLAFAVDVSTSGLDLNAIGVILMVVGVIGLAVSMLVLNGGGAWYGGPRRRTVVDDAYVDEPVVAPRQRRIVEDVVDDPPAVASRRRVVRRRDVI